MRWFLLSFSLTVLILGSCTRAYAQAGSTEFATWSTERVNGRAVTTFEPRGGSTGSPMQWVKPSAVGGEVTRTVQPGMVKYMKAMGIPYTSGVTGGTQTLAVTATRLATKPAVVKAVARTALGANPLGMTIMLGMAATEIFKWENGQLKTKLVQEEETSGMQYRHGYCSGSAWYSSPDAACADAAAKGAQAYMGLCGDTRGTGSYTRSGNTCTLTFYWNGSLQQSGVQHTLATQEGPSEQGCPEGYQVVPELSGDYRCAPVVPASAPDYPVTPEMMESIVGDLVGNDEAKLDDAANWWSQQSDSVAEPMELGHVEPSGASQLQPTTTTAPTQNNGTKQTTVQTGVTYNTNNSTVTFNENVTHIYFNEEGDEVGRETEENPQEDVPAVTDSNLPEVPDFYEQKYPEGMAGVWTEKKAALQSNPFTALLTSLQGNFSDGGQCPSWTLPSPLLGLSFGELQAPCWIWDVLGVIFVVTSLFAARRIIFGG